MLIYCSIDLTGQLSLVTSLLTLQWTGSSSSYSEITHRNYSQDTFEYCCQPRFLLWLVPLEEQGMKQEVTSEKGTIAQVGSASAGLSHPLWMLTPPKDICGQLGATQLHGMMQPHEALLPLPRPQYKMQVN